MCDYLDRNIDQSNEYHGLIAAGAESPNPAAVLPFTMVSLLDPRAPLQIGDPVNYRVAANGRAVEVELMRKRETARVETFRDGSQFGFLDFSTETNRQLFFHVSEVENGVQLEVGDWVSFFVTQHPKSGKVAAINLRRLEQPHLNGSSRERVGSAPNRCGDHLSESRPARLHMRGECDMSRGKSLVELIRQPRGPDGTCGFAESENPSALQA